MKKLPPAGFVLTGSPNPGRISSATNSPWPRTAVSFIDIEFFIAASGLFGKMAVFIDEAGDLIFCPFMLSADPAVVNAALYGWAGYQSRDDSEIYLGDWVQASIYHQPLAVCSDTEFTAWLAAH